MGSSDCLKHCTVMYFWQTVISILTKLRESACLVDIVNE